MQAAQQSSPAKNAAVNEQHWAAAALLSRALRAAGRASEALPLAREALSCARRAAKAARLDCGGGQARRGSDPHLLARCLEEAALAEDDAGDRRAALALCEEWVAEEVRLEGVADQAHPNFSRARDALARMTRLTATAARSAAT